ncbi:hypothetical protein L3N51_02458 [Metallosphaera sp. J1]|uniref:hypothetical protein n=1 Tax=Metallosphaera javensis (ex Hofmann et al. 2022) TaxID=99938 RepID=UPI001EDD30F1|nr:hypothetical protein [Metallosphaera javensis (ex Hofmann et al. 2022)]MCG3110161.1 hypothetical protein [Metallosphaera javensis (ex Hofmann et al. 2022)]
MPLFFTSYSTTNRGSPHGRRHFSTDPSTPEEIMTTWENRWNVEVIIREMKLGLEEGSHRSLRRTLGFIKLVSLTLIALLLVRYSLKLSLGVKEISTALKRVYLSLKRRRKV